MPGDEGTDTIRKISAVVQLSDPAEYEGGDFNIATVEKDATDWSAWPVDIPQLKQRGAAIFFPQRCSIAYSRSLTELGELW